jgi:hypothetical protein
MSPHRHEFTDFDRSIIAPLLPNKPRGVPSAEGAQRHFLAAAHGLAVGEYPRGATARTTCCNRFVRW